MSIPARNRQKNWVCVGGIGKEANWASELWGMRDLQSFGSTLCHFQWHYKLELNKTKYKSQREWNFGKFFLKWKRKQKAGMDWKIEFDGQINVKIFALSFLNLSSPLESILLCYSSILIHSLSFFPFWLLDMLFFVSFWLLFSCEFPNWNFIEWL